MEHLRSESDHVYSELARRRPAAELRDWVRGYTGYEDRAREVRTLREIPSGDVALIVSFGPALTIIEPDAAAAVLRRSFVAGVHDRYAVTRAPRRQHGLEIRLTPIGAYTFLGVPMSTLANHAVALDDVLGSAAGELAARLSWLDDWEARFNELDRVFARRLRVGRSPSPSTVWASRRLAETSGGVSIATLATEVGSSRKHLAERFHVEVGVPPKTLARVLRFRRAVRLLRESDLRLAAIARRCGYFDQAHFNRDFRELAGMPPGEFASFRSPAPA